MTRRYLERRNRRVFVLLERRKMAPKDVAALLGITYDNVRKIISLLKRHINSQKFTSVPQPQPLDLTE